MSSFCPQGEDSRGNAKDTSSNYKDIGGTNNRYAVSVNGKRCSVWGHLEAKFNAGEDGWGFNEIELLSFAYAANMKKYRGMMKLHTLTEGYAIDVNITSGPNGESSYYPVWGDENSGNAWAKWTDAACEYSQTVFPCTHIECVESGKRYIVFFGVPEEHRNYIMAMKTVEDIPGDAVRCPLCGFGYFTLREDGERRCTNCGTNQEGAFKKAEENEKKRIEQALKTAQVNEEKRKSLEYWDRINREKFEKIHEEERKKEDAICEIIKNAIRNKNYRTLDEYCRDGHADIMQGVESSVMHYRKGLTLFYKDGSTINISYGTFRRLMEELE